jgi:hypothetical protein
MEGFNLYNQGLKENELKPISWKNFRLASNIAFLMHDLGNIAEGAYIFDGKMGLNFNSGFKYRAEGAEQRSMNITKLLLGDSGLLGKDRDRFLPLVLTLIDQTRFNLELEDKANPFSLYARIVDQVGNGFLHHCIEGFQEGLAREEGASCRQDETDWKRRRLLELIPDEDPRNEIIRIFS